MILDHCEDTESSVTPDDSAEIESPVEDTESPSIPDITTNQSALPSGLDSGTYWTQIHPRRLPQDEEIESDVNMLTDECFSAYYTAITTNEPEPNEEADINQVERRLNEEIDHPITIPRSYRHLQSMQQDYWYNSWIAAYKKELGSLFRN